MLNLHRLRFLVLLRSLGTMAAVAEATGYSTSTVSQQIVHLERETGVKLTRRDGRGVALTHVAHELCQQAEVMIAQNARTEALLADWKHGDRSTVVVAMEQGLAARCLGDFMLRMSASEPGVRVVVQQAMPGERQLEVGRVDIYVSVDHPGITAPSDTSFTQVDLAHDALVLISPPEWTVPHLRAADPYPWAMATAGTPARVWTEDLVRAAGLHPRVQYQLDMPQTQIALAEAALALAVVPSYLVGGADVYCAPLAGDPAVAIRATMNRGMARSKYVRAVCDGLHDYLTTVSTPR